MKFYACGIGEKNPDFTSTRIQRFLTWLHGLLVDWSHNGIEAENCGEDSGFWDSTGRGFAKCTMDEALDHGNAVMRWRIELEVRSPIGACLWLDGCKGKTYPHIQYLTFLVVLLPFRVQAILKRFTPKWIKKLLRNGAGRLVCSEALARFIKANCPGAHADPRLAEEVLDDIDPYEAKLIAWDYRVRSVKPNNQRR